VKPLPNTQRTGCRRYNVTGRTSCRRLAECRAVQGLSVTPGTGGFHLAMKRLSGRRHCRSRSNPAADRRRSGAQPSA
jgi:hypothetical protein